MAAKKRGLGRGLDSLLSGSIRPPEPAEIKPAPVDAPVSSAVDQPATSTTPGHQLRNLPVEFIKPGKYQPRTDLRPESLEELANSIRSQGVMQPIVVRQTGDKQFEIIAGERRWRASQIAGLDTIPVIIREVPDEAAVAMALIENIQRENLNPVEEATALKRLQDEFELTQQEVADAVGKSRSSVANLLRLMTLVPEVRTYLEHGDLEMGHARALLALKENAQIEAARTVISRALSVRQTEALVRKLLNSKQSEGDSVNASQDPDIRHLQDKLAEKLGAQVHIQHSAKGKGRLILKYNSLDELDGILSHIK